VSNRLCLGVSLSLQFPFEDCLLAGPNRSFSSPVSPSPLVFLSSAQYDEEFNRMKNVVEQRVKSEEQSRCVAKCLRSCCRILP
jgi:hypothetical protein